MHPDVHTVNIGHIYMHPLSVVNIRTQMRSHVLRCTSSCERSCSTKEWGTENTAKDLLPWGRLLPLPGIRMRTAGDKVFSQAIFCSSGPRSKDHLGKTIHMVRWTMDCVGNNELWWATEGDWSMKDRVLKQGHRVAAEQLREEKGINKHFFSAMLQRRHWEQSWRNLKCFNNNLSSRGFPQCISNTLPMSLIPLMLKKQIRRLRLSWAKTPSYQPQRAPVPHQVLPPHTPQCRDACSKIFLLNTYGPKCDENGNIPQLHIPNAPTIWLPPPLASWAVTCCYKEGDSAAHWIHRDYSFQLLRLRRTMHTEMSFLT